MCIIIFITIAMLNALLKGKKGRQDKSDYKTENENGHERLAWMYTQVDRFT